MCVYIIVCKFKTYPDITCCNMYFGRVYMICTTCNLHIAMRELKVHRMPENLQIGTQSGDCVILLCKQLSHNFDHQSLSQVMLLTDMLEYEGFNEEVNSLFHSYKTFQSVRCILNHQYGLFFCDNYYVGNVIINKYYFTLYLMNST